MHINIETKIDNKQMSKDVIDIHNSFTENIYLFDSTLDIDFNFTSNRNIFNSNTFNIFCTYKRTFHDLFSQIKKEYIDISTNENFDCVKIKPYLTGEIITKDKYMFNTKYDYGIDSIGEYFGLFVVHSNADIKINDNSITIKENTLNIFSSKDALEITETADNFLAIEFYISGLRNLNMQYYGKWIPLL